MISLFWQIVIALIFLAIISAIFSPVKMHYELHLCKEEKKHMLCIKFLCFQKKIQLPLQLKELFQVRNTSKKIQKKYRISKEFIKGLLSKVHITTFYTKMEIGTEDAAFTALICGLIQQGFLDLILLSPLKNKGLLLQNTIIQPSYEKQIFRFQILCILRITLANIIVTIISLRIQKRRKQKHASH